MNTKSALILYTGSLLFGLLLCYIDDKTQSVSALFTPGMLLIGLFYSIPAFLILLIIKMLKFGAVISYSSLFVISFLITYGLVDFSFAYTGALVFYTIIFFLLFATTYFIDTKFSRRQTN